MNLLHMRGAWGASSAWLYAQVVAQGMPPLYDRFVHAVVPPAPPQSLIIDVGCGDGQVARRLALANPTARVLGLDLSPAMVRRARRGHADVGHLVFEAGDAMSLPLADATVALAVSVASIKHWPDPAAGMWELQRVLAPGGVVCLAEAERGCSLEAARAFVAYWHHLAPGTAGLVARYFQRFVAGQGVTLAELDRLAFGAGFTDVETAQDEALPIVVLRARKPGP